ncbi:MAG TPA: hypothetical protein VFR58_18785 [Flavisolibacter sp.]|nr:hypothetical protein [Flavisolibacter sp.]
MKQFTLLLIALSTAAISFCQRSSNPAPVKIASYTAGSFVNLFTFDEVKTGFTQANVNGLNIPGTLVAYSISDPAPQDPAAIPYVNYIVIDSLASIKTTFGHRIYKVANGRSIDYYIDLQKIEADDDVAAYRAWKCTATSICGGCDPVRKGFLGLGGVDHCDCTGSGAAGTRCSFETSGSGSSAIPWAGIVAAIATLIDVFHKD